MFYIKCLDLPYLLLDDPGEHFVLLVQEIQRLLHTSHRRKLVCVDQALKYWCAFKVALSALKWNWHSQRDWIELRLGKEIPLSSHKSDLVEIRLSTNCFQLCLMSRKIKHTKIKAFFSLVSTEPSKVSHPTLNFVWTHESLSNLGCVIPDEARKCPTWPPRLPDQTRWAGWGAAPGC